MFHTTDLKALLLQDYQTITKSELLTQIADILALIDQTHTHMTAEYKTGEYNYNFKQTLKHLIKTKHSYTMTDLQRKKDLVVHYREMLQLDVMLLTQHMSELLTNDILDPVLLQHHQTKITDLQTQIAHLSAVIKSLKEIVTHQ